MKLIKLSLFTMTALLAIACGDAGKDGANGTNGADGPAGEPGKSADGNTNDPSISIVNPSRGILDREIEVQIGGSGTQFEEGAKPDFGEGIEVVEVITSSRSLINAKLKIAANAATGPRKVTIGSLAVEGAFTVAPAIDVKGGTVEQGGIVELAIDNNDTRAFDAQAFKLEAAGLMDLGSQATGPQAAAGFLLAPPLAKAGKTQIAVQNLGADGKPKLSFLSSTDAMEIKPRTPLSFTLDTPSEETFASPLETKLWKLTTPGTQAAIVDYRVQVAADGTAVPVAFLFGTNGDADAQLGRAAPPSNPFTGQYNPPPYDLHVAVPVLSGGLPNDHYVVVADLGAGSGKATVTASRTNATAVMESGTAHGPDAPQAVGAVTATNAQIATGELASEAEADVYKFTVDAADKIQVTASAAADLEIIITKDPNVFEDAPNTPPQDRKVLGYMYPGDKFAAQRSLATAVGGTDVYLVVLSDIQGAVKTGKYTLGVRKLP